MKKVLITGSSGFIGRALVNRLDCDDNLTPICLSTKDKPADCVHKWIKLDDNVFETDLSAILSSVDIVCHVAGLAHSKNVSPSILDKVNVEFTTHLAQQAALHNVERFVFISSASVYGDISTKPFSELSALNPQTNYALSKYKAEINLFGLNKASEMELVVIRPPLIYGKSAPGAFSRLVKLLSLPLPLPLKSIRNKRSFLSLDNFLDFLVITFTNELAANEIFNVCDAVDVSTSEFVDVVLRYSNCNSILFNFNNALLELFLTISGNKQLASSLLGTFQLDSTKARTLLGFSPQRTLEQGIKSCFTE